MVNADAPDDELANRVARKAAARLMESVRGEPLEAAITAACDVVYNQWVSRDQRATLSDAGQEKLESAPLRSIAPSSVARLADALAQCNLTSREEHSAVFEALISTRANSLARAGLSFSSSQAVADLMAQLAGPGRAVLDPACGFGGTLLAAARLATRTEISGVDVNAEAAEFARRRLELAGFTVSTSRHDWLEEEPFPKWDAVLVEPPLGMKAAPPEKIKADGSSRFGRGNIGAVRDSDMLWLLHAAEAITPRGRAVILTSDGVGFRGGRTAEYRRALLSSGRVEAIIAMPAGSVLGSAAATCIWVLGGEPDPRKNGCVLLVNARAADHSQNTQLEQVANVGRSWLDAGQFDKATEDWFAQPTPVDRLVELNDATPQRHLATPPEQVAPRPVAPGRLLTELRLESFKSVGPEVTVPLKPLTLVFGKNSAGKSSLIQSILLIKQSIEAGRLTAGGHLVNLGSIAGLAHNHDESTPIRMGVSFSSSSDIDSTLILPNPAHMRSVNFHFAAADDRSGALAGVEIGLGEENFRWARDANDSSVAVASLDDFTAMVRHAYSEDSVHPSRKPSTSNQPRAAVAELNRMGHDHAEFVIARLTPHGPTRSLLAESRHRLSGTTRTGRLEGMLRTVGALFGAVGDELHSLMGRIAYLGPLRQAPERLSLRASGPGAGLDVPFFLLDNTSERQEVSERLQQLGVPYDLDAVTVSDPAERSLFGDIAALVLTDTRTGTRLSAADVGFGISQVLPIVTELSARTSSVILIEQPEIHLHPAMQADLADLLIESIDENGRANQVIAETHSESIMLRVQRRIREGSLSPSSVAVLYVDQDESGTSLVRQLRLDEDGDFLDSWPHGFFAERFDDVFGGLE